MKYILILFLLMISPVLADGVAIEEPFVDGSWHGSDFSPRLKYWDDTPPSECGYRIEYRDPSTGSFKTARSGTFSDCWSSSSYETRITVSVGGTDCPYEGIDACRIVAWRGISVVTRSVNIDLTPPIAKVFPEFPVSKNDITFSFECSDLHSGCQSLWYEIWDDDCEPGCIVDSGSETSYIMTCPIGSVCTGHVEVESVDNVLLHSAIKSTDYVIDKVLPSPNPAAISGFVSNSDSITVYAQSASGTGSDPVKYMLYDGSSNFLSESYYPEFLIGGLSANMQYCFRVRYQDFAGNIGTISDMKCEWTRPAVPIIASVTAVSSDSIEVTLNGNGNQDGTNYRVSVYYDNGNFVKSTEWTSNLRFNIGELLPNTKYKFRAEAMGHYTSWLSEFSSPVSTLAKPVLDLVVKNANGVVRDELGNPAYSAACIPTSITPIIQHEPMHPNVKVTYHDLHRGDACDIRYLNIPVVGIDDSYIEDFEDGIPAESYMHMVDEYNGIPNIVYANDGWSVVSDDVRGSNIIKSESFSNIDETLFMYYVNMPAAGYIKFKYKSMPDFSGGDSITVGTFGINDDVHDVSQIVSNPSSLFRYEIPHSSEWAEYVINLDVHGARLEKTNAYFGPMVIFFKYRQGTSGDGYLAIDDIEIIDNTSGAVNFYACLYNDICETISDAGGIDPRVNASGIDIGTPDSIFEHKRLVSIDNKYNANTLTDYSVRLMVDTATMISNGKMQSDCSDVRFFYEEYDSFGMVQNHVSLPYWIESGCNTEQTVMWLRVPIIAGNSNTYVYMYYGNSTVESMSNPGKTFIWYDDFERAELVEDVIDVGYANRSLSNPDLYSGELTTGNYETSGWIIESVKKSFSSMSRVASSRNYGTDSVSLLTKYVRLPQNDSDLHISFDYSITTDFDDTFEFWIDDREYFRISGDIVWNSARYVITPADLRLSCHLGTCKTEIDWLYRRKNGGSDSYKAHIDNLLIRKYSSPEPVAYISGEEIPGAGGLNNPIAVWNMDSRDHVSDLAQSLDRSGNAYHLEVINAELADAKLEQGYTFDGDNQFLIIPPHVLSNRLEGTIMFWHAPRSHGDSHYIVSSNDLTISYRAASYYSFGVGGTYSDGYYGDSSDWRHVAVTWGLDGIRIYLDGMLVETVPNSRGVSTSGTVLIGGYWLDYDSGHTVRSMRGTLDRMKVYDRQLSDVEILSVYETENNV